MSEDWRDGYPPAVLDAWDAVTAARQYKDPPIVVYSDDKTPMVLYEGVCWTVRRLMPVECERERT